MTECWRFWSISPRKTVKKSKCIWRILQGWGKRQDFWWLRKSIRNCSARKRNWKQRKLNWCSSWRMRKPQRQKKMNSSFRKLGIHRCWDISGHWSVRAMNLWQPGSGNMSRSPNCFRSIRWQKLVYSRSICLHAIVSLCVILKNVRDRKLHWKKKFISWKMAGWCVYLRMFRILWIISEHAMALPVFMGLSIFRKQMMQSGVHCLYGCRFCRTQWF